MSRLYIVYDSRAIGGNTDEAQVYCTADSLHEAQRDVKSMFPDGVVYSYAKDYTKHPPEIVDERFEWVKP